jgi:hypothetical protein
MWIVWIALIVAVPILIWIAFTVAGALYPSRPLAVSALKKELTKADLSSTAFSEECLAELADSIVRVIKFQIDVGTKKGPLNSFIEDDARAIASIVYNLVMGDGDDYKAAALRAELANETPNFVWVILAKHDPHRLALDNLEKCQEANRLQRHIAEGLVRR